MNQNDIISIIGDAITEHESYISGSRSVRNNNCGNIKYVGQTIVPTVGDNDGFCITKNFWDGRTLLEHDIFLKLTKDGFLGKTILALISEYAPASDNNNVQAYYAALKQKFLDRNVVINDSAPISALLESMSSVLIVINSIYEPDDWHAIQDAIKQVATYIPNCCFTLRYSNDTNEVITIINTLISPSTSVLSGDYTKSVLAPYNEGQPMNILVYNGSVMLGKPEPAGGCEYQGILLDPVSFVSSVMYQGAAFVDPFARVILHEIEHGFAQITKQNDIVHSYLIAHGGYNENLAIDLLAIWKIFITPQAVGTLVGSEVQLVDTNEISASAKVGFLQKILNLFK